MTEKKKRMVKCSYMVFALLLEELLSGPSTVKALADHTGLGHRYMCRFISILHGKGVIHVSGWEGDSRGRMSVRVYSLGQGKDAKKPPPKSREAINRRYRVKAAGAFLAGTPFAGLLAGNDTSSRRAA